MGCCLKKKKEDNKENKENLILNEIPKNNKCNQNIENNHNNLDKNDCKIDINKRELEREQEQEKEEEKEQQKIEQEDDDDDWLKKHGKPVTKQDTRGRISLLFYGPCHSGKSQLFNYIEKYSSNEHSGAFVGVAFFKKQIKIKNLDIKVDCYDIGSYNGNQNKKAWFIERCDLFIIIFDPTVENCVEEISDCLNKIQSRKNKDPYKICLCATKMDLIDAGHMTLIDEIQNNFQDFKLYKLNKDSGEEIAKMFFEFIEENYDDIKDTLKGIDDLDIINSEDYSYMNNLLAFLNQNMIHQ